jgi:SAM-dependent methyltransferase
MLNIVVVYTDRIPQYGEHFTQMGQTGITLHNADCILALGQDYNEDIVGFREKSIYRNTSINVIPFGEQPNYQQPSNDTYERNHQLTYLYKNNAANIITNTKTPYDLVIYTHTNVLNLPTMNWNLLYEETLKTDCLYVNSDRTFICGSPIIMMKYLRNGLASNTRERVLDLNTEVMVPAVEKYNALFGFRGLEETCDSERYTTRNVEDAREYSFDKMNAYDTVYFSNLSLRKVYKQLYRIIKKPFILVTGEGDCECPNELFETAADFDEFLKWDKLQHWFCQNCLIVHPKITLIPLGLDYHTMMYYSHIRGDRGPKLTPMEQETHLMVLRKTMRPFWERIPVCYGNFQFLTTTKYGGDRKEAIAKIPPNAIYYDCKHQRKQTFINQTAFAFVASPFGQDYECIRTWEALCLGCIAIIKSCPLDRLYEGLPVIIIQDWSEVTPEFLQKTLVEYKEKHLNNEFKYEKLHKYYWVRLVQQMKDSLITK